MLADLLKHIQISEAATYAFILSTVGPLAYAAPKYILSLSQQVINSLFHSFEFHYSEESYGVINGWLSKNINHIKMNRSKRVVSKFDFIEHGSYSNYGDDEDETERTVNKWKYIPSYGAYFMKPPQKPWMLIRRTKEEKKEIVKPTDTIYISVPFWSKSKVMEMFSEIQAEAESRIGSRIFISSSSYFYQAGTIQPDDTRVLFTKESLELLEDVRQFFNNEQIYLDRGVPYKKGYMLFGQPGTGKSKIIESIARILQKDIYIISNYHFTTNLSELLTRIPKGSIILAEDIDTYDIKKRPEDEDDLPINKSQQNSNSLGAILNALDGINSYSGSVLFMTTNKIEMLDKALIRAGRIDKKIEVGNLRVQEMIQFFTHFYRTNKKYKYTGDNPEPISISELYNLMIGHWSNESGCARELMLQEE